MAGALDVLPGALAKRKADQPAVQKVAAALRGVFEESYMPRQYDDEYKVMRERAIANWLPLIVDVVAENLFVEGFRRPSEGDNLPVWEAWTANKLSMHQSAVHRGALAFGQSYVTVIPGDPFPVVKSAPATSWTVCYESADSEWPLWGLRRVRKVLMSDDGEGTQFELWDETACTVVNVPGDGSNLDDIDAVEIVSTEAHGFGVPPIVRFMNRLPIEEGAAPQGEVAPLIPIQLRLNETTLGLIMAQHYSAFRQRWATGINIPRDPKSGEPVEPFKAAVNRLWMTDSKDATFGEFNQTDLNGFLASLEAGVKSMAAIAQVPPHFLLGGLVNISADALLAAQQGLKSKTGERQTLFGESWAQVFRLIAAAMGDIATAEDTMASVVWRDNESRSLPATVDGLGKASQMLGIPGEGLWSRIPGVTAADVAYWRKLKDDAAVSGAMADFFMGGAGSAPGLPPAAGPVV
ncbi:phage portal protein [Kitasatospora purpeofusca]|uniref:phage portal protein n=1 Tax=Kitasatospora purpeofusca TaxID=67352 RepID=UPI00224D6CA0|nr:phage portal protein [Kitasatospora purpeofusca]MCX4687287.1 phage portal protein [Kitasatospora purpeofusca]